MVPRFISFGFSPCYEPDQSNQRGHEYYRADHSRDDYLYRCNPGQIVLIVGAPAHSKKRPENRF